MDKIYDIGIFGLWYGRNYGSMSTYYALNKAMKNLGFSTVMIDNPLKREDSDLSRYPRSHPLRFAEEQKYEITPTLSIRKMPALNKICKAFLLGADQMWNYHLSKPYKYSYFLDFADDDRVKVSYGTSFGAYPYNGPASELPVIREKLKRFTSISVRDDFSQKIITDELGLQATQMPDPVFLCEPKDYEPLLNNSFAGDFCFSYILDPTPELGKAIEKIINITGKKMHIIFDEPIEAKDAISQLDINSPDLIPIEHATVGEWLSHFKYSDFVITDSFHGTCFSSVFNKEFISLRNKKRGSARFDCLINMLGIDGRLVDTPDELLSVFNDCYNKKFINYDEVIKRIQNERDRGLKWLKSSFTPLKDTVIAYPETKNLYPEAITSSLDPKLCIGCGACINACPFNALSFTTNDFGYYVPVLDIKKCTECGKCISVCPALNRPDKNNSKDPSLYVFQALSDKLLTESTSGGVFSLLAEIILSRNGVVVGAAWTDDLSVEHIMIDNSKDLERLRKSKYIQSYMGDIYKKVRAKLESNTPVLFTGCPCQVAGLKNYLEKDYLNLYLIDILCANAPSAKFFKKYIEDSYDEPVSKFEFRHKGSEWTPGWSDYSSRLKFSTGEERIVPRNQCDYQKSFHPHIMCSVHCEQCQYSGLPRFGDITIGDFWGINKKISDLEYKKGVSAVLCNNEKGEKLFNEIDSLDIALKDKVPLKWLGGNGHVVQGHNFASLGRNAFYKLINNKSFSDALKLAYNHVPGVRTRPYTHPDVMLQYDASFFRFHFDNDIWQEKKVKEGELLSVVSDDVPAGKYAYMKLGGVLKKNVRYMLYVRFKIKSDSEILNLHIQEAGTKNLQIIHRCDLNGRNNGTVWIEGNIPFTPNGDHYNAFMIGSRHISGKDNFIIFSEIDIRKDY